jgi:hypothetical protein
MAIYWKLLDDRARREQETAKPSAKVNFNWSRAHGPGLVAPLSPFQKTAGKVHLFGKSQRQGHDAEERFTRIFLNFIAQKRAPACISGVDYPTPEEELKKKADRVVVTNSGCRLPVQIKSTLLGKAKFHSLYGDLNTPCVVVDFDHADVVVFWLAIDEIYLAYEVMYGQQLCD